MGIEHDPAKYMARYRAGTVREHLVYVRDQYNGVEGMLAELDALESALAAERVRADEATQALEEARRHIERAERALEQISLSAPNDTWFKQAEIARAALADLARSVSESATEDGAAY